MAHLVWFRSDLRTRDNRALHAACVAAKRARVPVIGVFVICPDQWRVHDWAGVKVDLVLRTLRELSASLARLNIPLLIEWTPHFDGVPKVLLGVAKRHAVTRLDFSHEYEVNEARRDERVSAALGDAGVAVHAHHDQVLLPPGDVRTGEGRWFTVFSPFRRAYYKELERRGLPGSSGECAVLPAPPAQEATGIESGRVPESLPGFETTVPSEHWPAGEAHAGKRLEAFVERKIAHYKERRDFPGIDATSALSPYLSIGAVSPRQCFAAAIAANGGKLESAKHPGATHWISELAWREFYRNILVGFPRVCMHRAFKPATERIRWADAEDQFAAWCAGRTGVPIVDAGMRQLRETGWMHNRVRMITAMYLTKDLFIDWRRGERHFMRHLVDGDLAQNNGGWQWSASTGTDAAPYFRIFNPILQSRKFDPTGEYIKRFVPELRDLPGGEDGTVHDPADMPPLARRVLDYPSPLVDRNTVKERVLTAFQALAE